MKLQARLGNLCRIRDCDLRKLLASKVPLSGPEKIAHTAIQAAIPPQMKPSNVDIGFCDEEGGFDIVEEKARG